VAEEVRAEMVANVLKVIVREGDQVDVGASVVLLESMKMEIPVLTETSGLVREVKVAEGDVVRAGDLLALID
jgi:acetyl-CoA carboxylase biotin carboxyl carrier protein